MTTPMEFQTEVRDFLAANTVTLPDEVLRHRRGLRPASHWDKVLFDAGLSVITWPKKYGGRDATLLQWIVYEEEYFRAGAPGRASANGTSMLAPTLFAHGTEEQLDRVLPKMASGEEIWAQAWSEPESGSDLASLRSTATKTDGGWLLNGQKIWSSRAPFADRAFGLFRSDPAAQRHSGLTYFMFDLKADGRHRATDRPARRRHRVRRDLPRRRVRARRGRHRRAERRLARRDEHVEQRARHVAAQPGPLPRRGRATGRVWKDRPGPGFADRVADAWIKAQAYRLHTFGTVTRLAAGGELGAESSVTKVFWSDLDVALHQTALDIRGADGELADPWTEGLLFALGGPIYAGTNEIQRNIIAERLLGLPQEGRRSEIRTRRTAARLRGQHRRRARAPPTCPLRFGPGRRATPRPAARCGRHWPTSASPRWSCRRSSTASTPTRSTWWSPPNASAAGACPDRSPNPSLSHRFCLPTRANAVPLWLPAS